MFTIRTAADSDVEQIRDIMIASYGTDYAYPAFYDVSVLKSMVYSDDMCLLVAEDKTSGQVVGTASVVLDTGARSDLACEFGRLVVHPDFRRQGLGKQLLETRVKLVKDRLHVGLVEPRLLHNYSQKSVCQCGFTPVGFLPMQLLIRQRESVGLCVQYFGEALALRRNHPRVIPEAHALADLALRNCGLPSDAIVDERTPPYPFNPRFTAEWLTSEGYLPLLHIERGRLQHREVFGPVRLHYGLFAIRAENAQYIVVRENDRIVGAVGFTIDVADKAGRIFELIAVNDEPVRFLLGELCRRCQDDLDVEYLAVDVSAYAPGVQRTFLELGFLPVAYVPAMVFHEVERLDALRMVRLFVPPNFDNVTMVPEIEPVGALVIEHFNSAYVLPSMAQAVMGATFFHGLSDEQMRRVAATCCMKTIPTGQTIFRHGERDDNIYLVLDGTVDISLPEQGVTVGTVHAGESLGEISLLSSSPHSATATAREAVEAAVLPHGKVNELVRARPDIGVVLYRNLAHGLGCKLQRADLPLDFF